MAHPLAQAKYRLSAGSNGTFCPAGTFGGKAGGPASAGARAQTWLKGQGHDNVLRADAVAVVRSLAPKGCIGSALQTALVSAECVKGNQSAIVGRLATLGVPSTPATAVDTARLTLPSSPLGSALQTALMPAEYIANQTRSKPPAVLTPEQQARIVALQGGTSSGS